MEKMPKVVKSKEQLPICHHCGKPINKRRLASDVCMCEWKGIPSTRPIKNKNMVLLLQFANYCEEHPQERFWQALRNWSNYNFIYGSTEPTEEEHLQDTFYKEDK
jgi:hypothetical protein